MTFSHDPDQEASDQIPITQVSWLHLISRVDWTLSQVLNTDRFDMHTPEREHDLTYSNKKINTELVKTCRPT